MNIIIIVNLTWPNQTRSSITIITITKVSLSKLNQTYPKKIKNNKPTKSNTSLSKLNLDLLRLT
jgi:hypothetical protein